MQSPTCDGSHAQYGIYSLSPQIIDIYAPLSLVSNTTGLLGSFIFEPHPTNNSNMKTGIIYINFFNCSSPLPSFGTYAKQKNKRGQGSCFLRVMLVSYWVINFEIQKDNSRLSSLFKYLMSQGLSGLSSDIISILLTPSFIFSVIIIRLSSLFETYPR